MKTKGIFVCVEGLDGCGKTTQAKLLVAKLKKEYDAIYTAEPSNGKIGAFVRNQYLYGEKRVSCVTEALMFAADRIDHVENEILPALKDGQLVVSDRYLYSSLAYQGAAGLDLSWIEKINQFALVPDFGVYIDVDPKVVMQRLNRKKSVMEDLATQQKVREIYLKLVTDGHLAKIDGEKSKVAVAAELLRIVLERLH